MTTSEIEFSDWATPFQKGNLHIVEIRYGNGGFKIQDRDGNVSYEKNSGLEHGQFDLSVRVFSSTDGTLYLVKFVDVAAFRMMDEHGLTEMLAAPGFPELRTFRVKNHHWFKESPLVWHMASQHWSYMLSTNDECLEVVGYEEPTIEIEEILEPANS